MKILIHGKEEDPFKEIARIGWIPPENEIDIEVYVKTDDTGKVPHFHVRKYGKNNNFEWETCIRYDSAEYFFHGKYKDRLPDRKTAKELDKMLRRQDPDSIGSTYWRSAINEWNRNNSNSKLSIDIEQPDYSKL